MPGEYVRSLKSEEYEKYQVRIDQENRSGIGLVLIFDTMILLIRIIGMVFQNPGMIHGSGLMAQIVFLLIGLPFYLLVLRNREGHDTLWIYVYEAGLLATGGISETVFQPDVPNFTFMFLLLILPQLILDRPLRIILLILGLSLFYGILDGVCAAPAVFDIDIIHLITACLLSVAVSIYTVRLRIGNLAYTGYYAEKADTDPLTGLYNRFGAERHMDLNHPGLLVYLDLDHFKGINDRYGHTTGDRVLVATADVLRSCFRKDDILIRMGGDEFAVYARGTWNTSEIEEKMSHLRNRIDEIHTEDDAGNTVSITTSIGCAYAPRGCLSLDQLIHAADTEMYHVKANGRDSFRITMV